MDLVLNHAVRDAIKSVVLGDRLDRTSFMEPHLIYLVSIEVSSFSFTPLSHNLEIRINK